MTWYLSRYQAEVDKTTDNGHDWTSSTDKRHDPTKSTDKKHGWITHHIRGMTGYTTGNGLD
jgi:hypothetical protein